MACQIGPLSPSTPIRWNHKTFPSRAPTAYTSVVIDGQPAIKALADSANSALRHSVDFPAEQLDQLSFSWKVQALNPLADLKARDADDAVVRLVLTFDGDKSRFSAKDRMLSELALLLTGEPMPYATLMYVWDHQYPVGTVIHSPSTDRIRFMVIESGSDRLGRWVAYQRNVRQDFIQAFGEEPRHLMEIGLLSDSNSTNTQTVGWYGPIKLSRSSTH